MKIPILLAAAALLSSLAPQSTSIPAPDYWIAFDASIKTTSARGAVVGKYYQGSDGSTRNDSGPEDGPIAVVSISNVTLSTHYELSGGKWRRYPMRLPANGYRPALRSLTITRGLEPWSSTIEGFAIYRMTSSGGVVRYQAPALNFFAVRTEFGDSQQDCYDIVIREERPETFMPPADAVVEAHDEFRGIVSDK